MKLALITIAVSLALAGPVLAAKSATTDDYEPYSFTYSCDGFDVAVDGLNTGNHTVFTHNSDTPVRNVGHHHVSETHVNLLTGRTITFRGSYTSTYDYAADTQTFKGAFLIANEPHEGAVLQEVRLVEFDHTTGEIRSAGKHDILDLPYDPFCAALSASGAHARGGRPVAPPSSVISPAHFYD